MKTNTMVIVGIGAAILAAVYFMRNKTTQQAKTGVPASTTAGGTTVDALGNWWYGGAMIYKAPTQSWTT